MSYTLRDDGYQWRTIYHGRRSIGRVYRHAKGGYYGHVKPFTVGPYDSQDRAFAEIVAKFLGFASAAAMARRSREVRAHNRAHSARVRQLADRFLNGTWQDKTNVIDEVLGIPNGVHDVGQRIIKRSDLSGSRRK